MTSTDDILVIPQQSIGVSQTGTVVQQGVMPQGVVQQGVVQQGVVQPQGVVQQGVAQPGQYQVSTMMPSLNLSGPTTTPVVVQQPGLDTGATMVSAYAGGRAAAEAEAARKKELDAQANNQKQDEIDWQRILLIVGFVLAVGGAVYIFFHYRQKAKKDKAKITELEKTLSALSGASTDTTDSSSSSNAQESDTQSGGKLVYTTNRVTSNALSLVNSLRSSSGMQTVNTTAQKTIAAKTSNKSNSSGG